MSALVHSYRVNARSRVQFVASATSAIAMFACSPADPIFQLVDAHPVDGGVDSAVLDSTSGGCAPRLAGASAAGCQTTTRECLRDEFVSPDYCVNRDRNPQACASSIANNRWVCATRSGGCATALGCLSECARRECPSDSESCIDRAIAGPCDAVAMTFSTCLADSIESRRCPAYPPEAFVDFVQDGGTDARADAAVDAGVRDTAVVDLGVPDAAPCFSSQLGRTCSTASTCGGCDAVCQAFGFNDPICCMPLRATCRQSSDCCAGGGSTRSCSSAGRCCQGPQGICRSNSECCAGTCMIASGQSSGLCSR